MVDEKELFKILELQISEYNLKSRLAAEYFTLLFYEDMYIQHNTDEDFIKMREVFKEKLYNKYNDSLYRLRGECYALNNSINQLVKLLDIKIKVNNIDNTYFKFPWGDKVFELPHRDYNCVSIDVSEIDKILDVNIPIINKKDYIELIKVVINEYNTNNRLAAETMSLMYHKDNRVSELFRNKRDYLDEKRKKLNALSICIKSMKELAEKFGIEIRYKDIKDTFEYVLTGYNMEEKVYTDIPREYRMYYICR